MADYNEYIADCPFCAGTADPEKFDPFDGYQGDNTVYRVRCTKCGAEVCGGTYAEAVRKWNKRASKLMLNSVYGSSLCKDPDFDFKKAMTSENMYSDLIERVIRKLVEAYFQKHPEERSEE